MAANNINFISELNNKWLKTEEDILVKNIFKTKKCSKLYQIIFSGDVDIDGLYVVNSFNFDIKNNRNKKIVTIKNQKYDKLAGYDGLSINNFNSFDEFLKWIYEKKFINKEEYEKLKNYKFKSVDIEKDIEIVLDS